MLPAFPLHSLFYLFQVKESLIVFPVLLIEKANKTDADVDWLVPHQANIRIMTSTAKKLKLPLERVVVTVDQHGNTSAASIPLALDHAVKAGQIKAGQIVLMEGVGGGFTWGSALVRM